MRYAFFLTMLLFLFQFSYSQTFGIPQSEDDTSTTVSYRIDTTLKAEIEQEMNTWKEQNKHKKFEGLMDDEVFINDVETSSTYKKNKEEYFFPFVDLNEQDSTIQIVGTSGTPKFGSGFRIIIHKTECIVLYLIKYDGNNIFKQKKNDSAYKSYVMVRTQYHLTLTQMPLFKKGEIIQGRIELRSYSFYSKGKSEDKKMNVNIFANFTTPPLK